MGTSAFTGFPEQGLAFLAALHANNNRKWFEAHKREYQTNLLEPAQAFVSDLGTKLQSLSPGIRADARTDGTGVLMRIHRDTRFSTDKTPYKTELNGLFPEGSGKKTESPAFGFRLEAAGMTLMAGMFKFPPAVLAAYREAVLLDSSGTALETALTAVRKSSDYSIGGEHYKRVPAGLDAHHPRADLLRYDGLYVLSPNIPTGVVVTPALVNRCFDHFQNMAPVWQWLVKIASPD
jgi:uncharacterized protein (TIGR02453 family)